MNVAESLSYIDATIKNHLTGYEEVSIKFTPTGYDATLWDSETGIIHAETVNNPSPEAALIDLARVIREDTTIGA